MTFRELLQELNPNSPIVYFCLLFSLFLVFHFSGILNRILIDVAGPEQSKSRRYLEKGRDLSSLKDRQWLKDTIIDDFLQHYINIHQRDEAILLIQSHTYLQLISQRDFPPSKQTLKFLCQNEPMNKDLVLVVINDLGSHWMLGAICWTQKVVCIFDSLDHVDNSTHFLSLAKIVLISMELASQRFDYSQWRFLKACDMEKQRNGFDCGVHVCYMGASIVEKEMKRVNDSTDARNWIKSILKKAPVKVETHEKVALKLPSDFSDDLKARKSDLKMPDTYNEACCFQMICASTLRAPESLKM